MPDSLKIKYLFFLYITAQPAKDIIASSLHKVTFSHCLHSTVTDLAKFLG
jgi:hypothetical protein